MGLCIRCRGGNCCYEMRVRGICEEDRRLPNGRSESGMGTYQPDHMGTIPCGPWLSWREYAEGGSRDKEPKK